MATEKTIKIQKNKILTYSVNKEGFKTVYGSTVVSQNQNINVEMKNLSSETGAFQLGDRLFGISSFVDYFIPSGTYDVDSLKYISASQTTGTGLSNIQVVKGTSNTVGETGTWLSKVEQDLQIVTPKGSSNTFVFTYNGSTWDITGALTLAGQSLESFGISFEGTATSGNVITVTETQYNKFAFFVLDANYRSNQIWSSEWVEIMPLRYSNPQNCLESADYFNQYIFDNANLNNYPIFNYCKNLGAFILLNGIKINCLLPNGNELQSIYNNRVVLDSFDPITIANPSAEYNLSSWAFAGSGVWCCVENSNTRSWCLLNSGTWYYESGKLTNFGVIPIFEVPVM